MVKSLRRALVFISITLTTTAVAFAQDPPPDPPPPPPPPPPPSGTSYLDQEVTNPAIDPLVGSNITIVNGLETWEPVPGDITTQFVFTQDEWAFMVQPAGVTVYKTADEFFTIDRIVTTSTDPYASPTATLRNEAGDLVEFDLWQTATDWNIAWNGGQSAPGAIVPPDIEGGVDGRTAVFTGAPGAGGGWGTLFFRPGNGQTGQPGPRIDTWGSNSQNILATNRIGFEVGSRGGNGGRGGDSVLGFYRPGDGGNGGVGGNVFVTNHENTQIATQSATVQGLHGIAAFSQSGRGGDSGTGVLAPPGGTGGSSPNGGNVWVQNVGTVQTDSSHGNGISALSVSGNGGNGGSSWGLVGNGGTGGLAGNGGEVVVVNDENSWVITRRNFSVGISAMSIGGTGGSSGFSGNLLIALPSQGQAGGDGGRVTVLNSGFILTEGVGSRGIQALSNGGGGGDQGGSFGLIALGGQSGAGGSGNSVILTNHSTGRIETRGIGSSALYAQSAGGSGGSVGSSAGIVALGGNGAVAGNGGAVTVENYGTIVTRHIGSPLPILEQQITGSMGIFAQSIGGGGGDGGASGGLASIGGRGGAGGFSSLVQVTNGGNITTNGVFSNAIFAQSVGGGGGIGGGAVGTHAFAGMALGGNGGGGGHGGNVNVTLQGDGGGAPVFISTNGANARGVFAQSIGGGGGVGGGTVAAAGGLFGAGALSIGGSGGDNARGGDVTLTGGLGRTNIETHGMYSQGIVLQSVGGSGGDGGYAVSVAVAGGPVAGSVSFSQGGKGGRGGAGGIVRAGEFDALGNLISTGFSGNILTNGEYSTGLLAHSTGSGGGNGGLAVSAAGAGGVGFAGALSIALGGQGGGAGHGGIVQIGMNGNITTLQDKSIALLAQSVGGGGGNGGGSIAASFAGAVGYSAAVSIAMGGSGGGGGDGRGVTLATRSSRIETHGSDSAGIVIQSEGGGGGTGGYTVAVGGAGSMVGSGALILGIGGSGGSGGVGGTVIANLQSNVITLGATSAGIVAQSLGGGGGIGGFNVTVAGAGAGTGGAAAVAVGLGGTGGDGGSAGAVTLTSVGSISTTGFKSNGLTAQSIGGGGGTGGFNIAVGVAGAGVGSGALVVGLGGSGGVASHGGVVIADSSGGLISTLGADSIGVLAQSVGGGGGDGGFNVVVSGTGAGVGGSAGVAIGLGGNGGGGGDGGEVRLTVNNDVETRGANSGGVIAQSVGKAGGAGGFNVSVAGAVGTGGAVAVGLGGSGAGGGHGSRVTATATGLIHTVGDKSNAFTAQSLGGGGGSGGFNVAVAASGGGIANGAVSVGLGGSGAVAGHGGVVVANVTGDIWTEGQNSIGILAQSVGGGGGDGAFNVSVAGAYGVTGGAGVSVGLGGSAGAGGNADNVTLFVGTELLANTVTISGLGSMGIVAQSIGGGGGNGGFNVTAALAGGGTGGAGGAGIGLGGSGGAGGNAGEVNSTVFATIVNNPNAIGFLSSAGASDADAPVDYKTASGGLLAQSIGGGGGSGGFNVTGVLTFAGSGAGAVAVGIGGSGGDGGSASNVTNSFTGTVDTFYDGGFGIAAQSLGGSGGIGGMNFTGSITAAATGSGAVAFGLGGFGGGGGDAGEVHNTVNAGLGFVHTTGKNAVGVLAQSVGGGGGAGGWNGTVNITASTTSSGGVGIGLGGFGGDGGDGKKVVNHVTGGVVTEGADSQAILAQSVGGSGGAGGTNVTGSINLSKSGAGGTLGFGMGGFGGGGGNAGTVESTVTITDAAQYFMTSGEGSTAIVAQSMGGAGGVGGLNVTGSVALTGGAAVGVGIGLGGFGGGGGDASSVLLAVAGNVFTRGNDSHGLMAQSVGGSGGAGGLNVTGSLAATTSGSAGAISIGVGGFGGGGGNAGAVTVHYSGTLIAADRLSLLGAIGTGSHGIAAQSLGGGGGIGGMNVSAGLSAVATSGYGAVFGVGGFGGAGGNAQSVDVTVTGGQSITTYGQGKSAIFAQSLGGGGGDGGMNVSGGITAGHSLFFGVGGFGGDAGTAKKVTVNATTDVTVYQREGVIDPEAPEETPEQMLTAAGVFAQSLGGGGGNGGLNVTGGITFGASASTLTFGIGGFGGAGAAASDVDVTLVGDANTTGQYVHGILGQSIGGGGGNGGLNVSGQITTGDGKDVAIIAGVGGNGGDGADSGRVDVNHTGSITTFGDNARGVFAQSVAGGGGLGGMNVTALVSHGASPITVGVGGTGGDAGGHAGSVYVTRGSAEMPTGKVTTTGVSAFGIEASSIGGGGGDAGMNFVVGAALGVKDTSVVGSFVIGGSGGNSGNAGTVIVNNQSDIQTNLASSHGILAQSIGGGGGNGNYNMGLTASYAPGADNGMVAALTVGGQPGDGGLAAAVEVRQVGNVETFGVNSFGVLAQSIGGGGGNVGLDFNAAMSPGVKNQVRLVVTLGKVGGTGGESGNVTLFSNGSVVTHADGSFGLLAQSIGAGGGTSSTTSVALASQTTSDAKATTYQGRVSVGRTGGTGGGAGDVTVDASGQVHTNGKVAHAIFAQSVGGGGGSGGAASTANFLGAQPTLSVAVGGDGGIGGVGGRVDVVNAAALITAADSSIGILAQSVGGGGGSGGQSMTGGIGHGEGTLSVAVGGTGGEGNAGGIVDVTSSGLIDTDGLFSHGILAQSIGGGGGNGGMAINFLLPVLNPTVTDGAGVFAVQVGGDGGSGATSNEVTVTNTGSVVTREAHSIGMLAQSIGGGGGNAGNVYSGILTRTSKTSIFSFAIGGRGGEGGVGGDVVVANQSDSSAIETIGDASHGIYAMSIGGGGGIGSNTVTATFGFEQSSDASMQTGFTLGLGGNGGVGGRSGIVDVRNAGTIKTQGSRAHGIIAQSIGGGGGNGGYAVSGNLQVGGSGFGDEAPTVVVAVGGNGGSGNRASSVTVTNTGAIEVAGNSSCGIYAQSVGGGGGDGNFAVAATPNMLTLDPAKMLTTIGFGGLGGRGGSGGNVTVDNTGGTIYARGDDSYGVYAQSVGGGGGKMGWAVGSAAWTLANFVLRQTVGGGSLGVAGEVNVTGQGNIVMSGARSNAVFTQSVAGGGGNVDLYLDASKQAVRIGEDGIIIPTNPAIASWLILLGLGADFRSSDLLGTSEASDPLTGTSAGTVTNSYEGSLATTGNGSTASELQSIGGGGGTVNEVILVDTLAEGDFELAVGASHVENGDGGEIIDVRDGDVLTLGSDSMGALLQSIGGGGGSALIEVDTILLPDHTGGFAVGSSILGGDTTIASDGGTIDSTYTGALATVGDRSPGLLLQSIGAGGGQATMTGFDSIDVGIGGRNGASGNGANIDVSNIGSIETVGALSHGVILQSIGGGGGAFLSDSPDITVAANADNDGNGGEINFAQTGDVITLGDGSIGILAQSLGGGGGLINRLFMDTAGGAGTSGAINLNVNGDVAATGEDGVGIFAQSRGATSQGNIDIQFAADKRIVVGDSGVGVEISGGKDNTFVNDGLIFADSGLGSPDGFVVTGTEGNESITNNGILYGSVNLGRGGNALINSAGAATYAGAELFLGDTAADFFTNHGLLALGDTSVYTTNLTGSYVQSITGEMNITVDCKTDSIDLLHISRTASLEGKMNLLLTDTGYLKPGQRELIFLIADEGVSAEGLTLAAPESALAQFSIGAAPPLAAQSDGALFAVAPPNYIPLNMNVQFAGFGALNANQVSTGRYIDRVQLAGGSPQIAPMIAALIALPTATDVQSAYDSMSPEVYTTAQRSLELSSNQFVESMLGCNRLDSAYKFGADGEWVASNRTSFLTEDDASAPGGAEDSSESIQKGHFFWVNTTAGFYNSQTTSQYLGFNSNSVDVAVGVQFDLGDELYAGLALGYADINTNFIDGMSASSDGSMGEIGLSLTKFYGPTKIALGVAGGYGEFDVTRGNVFMSPTSAIGDFNASYYSARLRVSHEFSFTDWYIRPFVDTAFTGINSQSFNETGAGAMNLHVASATYNAFIVSPMVQVGREFKLGEWTIRPQASVGYSWYSSAAPSVSATLEGAPGVQGFQIYGLNDQNYFNTSGGIDLKLSNKILFQAVYSGQFSENTQSNNVQLKIAIPF